MYVELQVNLFVFFLIRRVWVYALVGPVYRHHHHERHNHQECDWTCNSSSKTTFILVAIKFFLIKLLKFRDTGSFLRQIIDETDNKYQFKFVLKLIIDLLCLLY